MKSSTLAVAGLTAVLTGLFVLSLYPRPYRPPARVLAISCDFTRDTVGWIMRDPKMREARTNPQITMKLRAGEWLASDDYIRIARDGHIYRSTILDTAARGVVYATRESVFVVPPGCWAEVTLLNRRRCACRRRAT